MDVISAGILVADIFSSPLDSLPKPGELTLTRPFLLSVGGCAANTALNLRRLGHSVTVMGKVGGDFFGDFVLQDLKDRGVETRNILSSPLQATSQTFILNVKGEDRRYIHSFGANAEFAVEEMDRSALQRARVLYVGGFLGMPAFDARELALLFRQAQERSVLTVLDVITPSGTSGLLDQVAQVLPYTDYFVPNEDEARLLTGLEDAAQQAEALARGSPRCGVVITRGERGAVALRQGRLLEAPSFAMETVDGSGAGDAFTAGFISALLHGWDLPESLRFASAVGASCTRAVGCTAGVFTFDEARGFLDLQPSRTAAEN